MRIIEHRNAQTLVFDGCGANLYQFHTIALPLRCIIRAINAPLPSLLQCDIFRSPPANQLMADITDAG
ncbi:hypothetical protein D3C78_1785280 [compost metagenome]